MIEGGRVRSLAAAVKDVQTVTSSGESVQELIHGVRLRHAATHADASRPYMHDDPDKYRLPIDSEEIPHRM